LSAGVRSAKVGIVQTVAKLCEAWNAGDADSYAEQFTDDADVVIISGERQIGKAAIVAGHRDVLAKHLKGSTMSSEIETVRFLVAGVALVHMVSHLVVFEGPAAGRYQARPSLVMLETGAGWRIAAFQNTLIADKRAALEVARQSE